MFRHLRSGVVGSRQVMSGKVVCGTAYFEMERNMFVQIEEKIAEVAPEEVNVNWDIDYLKKEWIKALRSSKYEQCVNNYKAGERSYCAMGVLMNIIDPRWSGDFYGIWAGSTSDRTDICEQMGVREEEVIQVNDVQHWSFKDIAFWLEVKFGQLESSAPSTLVK